LSDYIEIVPKLGIVEKDIEIASPWLSIVLGDVYWIILEFNGTPSLSVLIITSKSIKSDSNEGGVFSLVSLIKTWI